MLLSKLLIQLQTFPGDYEVKIPAKTIFELPDDADGKDDDEMVSQVQLQQLIMPVHAISSNKNEKTVYLNFNGEAFWKHQIDQLDKEVKEHKKNKGKEEVKKEVK